ncbi:leucyl aminopeptidase [Altererythrobacter xixiisoli]|uniref:Probable cytosol aminopeptidase n=1 Tax=Croceibacterium xixiisoli TaxID=1476466 RepID=A0A6I4TQJ2_9SPHN|nr:leucyl aminopeptidase [Croceibacterium xixiisoli]MXO98136.1 leucyl aminopeptidase [Croceibacterium xixiisoli]
MLHSLMSGVTPGKCSLVAGLLVSVALCGALPGVARAQSGAQDQAMAGSGVEPGSAPNSPERPVGFAASAPADGVLVVLASSAELPAALPLSAAERAALVAAIAGEKFTGAANAVLSLRGIGTRPRLMLVGTGENPAPLAWSEAAGKAAQLLAGEDAGVAIIGAGSAEAAAEVALGYRLGQYRFDRYRPAPDTPVPTQAVAVVVADAGAAQAAYEARQAGVAEGVRFARDLINEPASVIHPDSFVARTRAAFAGLPNVEIEVLDEAAMRRLGMGALVGVGQGSPRGSRLMLVTYRGAAGAPLALVGKGITFDSGGLSIKGGSGMEEMKADMSGAAAVMGAVLSLAKTRAPVHAVAVAALAENMPDGNAQRPGDVVRTFSGKTIEIINTDAEGRLVLADAVEYVAARRSPFAIVDIATLTGSAVSALGPQYAGLFAREDDVAQRVTALAAQVGEPVWRLPLHPRYADAVKSDIALVKNSGNSPAPGASAGAHFIEAFIAPDMPWAHIDMAPTMWADSAGPLTPKGATGYGVRLLDALAREWRP